MSVIESIILGLIQGITEFIPVSSSGHLTLFGRVFEVESTLMLSFSTMLHVGTLIAVFIVMRKDIKDIISDIFGKMTWLLVVATIPAVVAAVLLGDWFESLFSGDTLGYQFLITALVLLSILMIRPERNQNTRVRPLNISTADAVKEERTADVDEIDTDKDSPQSEAEITADQQTNSKLAGTISYKHAFLAGIGQAIAIMPGVSRSGSTLAALLFCKIERKRAIRFAFLMSIPAIAGGFVLDLLKMIKGEGSAIIEIGLVPIIAGMLAAAVSGYLAMNFMLRKLTSRGILVFAVYVIVLGIAILIDQTWLNIVF